MKKKVDSRVQTLLQNSITNKFRSIFVIIGDRARDQVVNIHQLISKANIQIKPKVLWCYKKDLGFTTHQRKRESELKKQKTEELDPFQLFLSTNQIRYCYYAETQKILGNTYNMLILQDFEALTPNILCRTIETVEGGGVVIFLIKTMTSLKALYSLSMDVHSRLRTHQFTTVQPRFNERFILSLSKLERCLFMDDELNLLPVSSKSQEIQIESAKPTKNIEELAQGLQEVVAKLVRQCKTLDQAKVVMSLVDSLQEKVFKYTISVQAARGRGKSAAIGMAAAAAIKMGFSNVFITAPNPENLNTFFQFLTQTLDALDYKLNQHYDVIQSTNPEFNNCIIRVNIFKSHRQFIQYVLPQDFSKIQSNADLVFCDEAAAIPLQFVKDMMGPYTLVLSSTINGYEGTGRSLSLKLIQKLREERTQQRILKELTMSDPIRYGANDPIEKWLYELLLLDATEAPKVDHLPHPQDCELYLVNRDTLFSYQKASEKFLFNLMSLFISSHYKNSPNDLQLLSDAPAHAVFVLLGPLNKEKSLPDILCAIQVCFEGMIPSTLVDSVGASTKPSGDLIPWTLSKYYLDQKFPQYSGVRVVRIATHPSAQKMGYGSKAIQLLGQFCKGEIHDPEAENLVHVDFKEVQLKEETEIKAKTKLPPLLKRLTEVHPPAVDYLGVSFGLTKELYHFWEKNAFTPAYLSLRKNDTTGEYTCIVLQSLKIDDLCGAFAKDFRHRFINLLTYEFKELEPFLCIDILQANVTLTDHDDVEVGHDPNMISKGQLATHVSLSDLERLDNYCKTMSDFYLILDLLPAISKIFFSKECGKSVRMSRTQAAILIAMGLQSKNVEVVAQQLTLDVSQILPLFNKAMRKFKAFFQSLLIPNQVKHVPKPVAKESKSLQKRGKINYQIDTLEVGNAKGDIITLPRHKEDAYIEKKVKK